MDEQTKLLTEIRDLLARSISFGEEQWAQHRADRAEANARARAAEDRAQKDWADAALQNRKAQEKFEEWRDKLERYEAELARYQSTAGASKAGLWIIGAIVIAVVAWIVTYGTSR